MSEANLLGQAIGEHLQNLFGEGELNEIAIAGNFRTTAADAKVRRVDKPGASASMAIRNFLIVQRRVKTGESLAVRVGWVEQRETQHESLTMSGFIAFNPAYDLRRGGGWL